MGKNFESHSRDEKEFPIEFIKGLQLQNEIKIDEVIKKMSALEKENSSLRATLEKAITIMKSLNRETEICNNNNSIINTISPSSETKAASVAKVSPGGSTGVTRGELSGGISALPKGPPTGTPTGIEIINSNKSNKLLFKGYIIDKDKNNISDIIFDWNTKGIIKQNNPFDQTVSATDRSRFKNVVKLAIAGIL